MARGPQYQRLGDAAEYDPRYAGTDAEIWYTRPELTRDFMVGYDFIAKRSMLPDAANLGRTHIRVGAIDTDHPEEAFDMMQGERWSPQGEAYSLIGKLGLDHTSMSIGDVVVIRGEPYIADRSGFRSLGPGGAYLSEAYPDHALEIASSASEASKTKLDLILDQVQSGKREATFDTDGYTEEQVNRIITTAKARGLHAAYDGRFVLVRDLRRSVSRSDKRDFSEAMPALAQRGTHGLPQLYHLRGSDSDSYFLALEPTKSRLSDYKGLQVTWWHDKRKPEKAKQVAVQVARPGERIGFHEIGIEDVPQAVIDRFEKRLGK